VNAPAYPELVPDLGVVEEEENDGKLDRSQQMSTFTSKKGNPQKASIKKVKS